jgi:hypothetical protein
MARVADIDVAGTRLCREVRRSGLDILDDTRAIDEVIGDEKADQEPDGMKILAGPGRQKDRAGIPGAGPERVNGFETAGTRYL